MVPLPGSGPLRLGGGEEGWIEGDAGGRQRPLEGQGLEVLGRHLRQQQRRRLDEAEAAVEGRLPHQHAAGGTASRPCRISRLPMPQP